MTDEVMLPTVDEVCVIQGAGRGECWACPVRDCVLWQNPANPFSEATQATALAAAARLASRVKVIQPVTEQAQDDLVGTALGLALTMADKDVQYRVLVDMACEAVMQDLLHALCVKRRNQYTDRWTKGLKGRLPTMNDDIALDHLLEQADADVAAEAYGVKPELVLRRLAWFRGRRIVRMDHDL